MQIPSVQLLILDIGGVLLSDGWDGHSRAEAATHFSFDLDEYNVRHTNVFDAYESGKMDLDEYLKLTIFYQERSFSPDEFKDFMMQQSQPFIGMIELIWQIKQRYQPRIISLNNEPKELNEYRIQTFKLNRIIDFFVSSCYVKMRKPDRQFYEMALGIAQVQPQDALYIDDRQVYTQFAAELGINTIHHTSAENTRLQLQQFGFDLESVTPHTILNTRNHEPI